jgi:probable rRNA maturation factor
MPYNRLEIENTREIIIEAEDWNIAPFADGEASIVVAQAIEAVAEELALSPNVGLTTLLTDDLEMRKLNKKFRGKDYSTNVLSFPAFSPDSLPSEGHIGDIAVALETVLAEASAENKLPAHHLAHMIVHGLAHLAGHDHISDGEADIMEALEVRALARLGIANPYLDEAVET